MTETDTLVTKAFTIPTSDASRIDRMAQEQDPHNPNASRVMREILREYFAAKDAEAKKPAKRTPAAA